MFHIFEKIAMDETYIIAEISANHGGSIENALELVRQSAEAGADCVKIQTYTADSLTIDCNNQYFRIQGGLWDGCKLYDLYQEAGTPYEWQGRIKEECEKCGVDFLSTPFDNDAVDFLESLGAEAYKIASFELVDIPLIEYAASKGKPMIISTGMGSLEEIQDAIDACQRAGNDQIVLLKCCSEYPAPWEDMHLRNIPDMKQRFRLPIGLSDHSAGSLGAVVGVTLGACVVEKHIKLPDIESADSKFSMEITEFAQMVKDVRNAKLIAKGPDYTLTAGEKKSTVFRRSLFAVKDIKAGELLSAENVRSIRPGYGIKPKYLETVVSGKSCIDIKRGEPINEELLGKLKDGFMEDIFLRYAVQEDAEFLFNLVNDCECRGNSFNPQKITWKEHMDWFRGILLSGTQKQYILMDGNTPVGQGRLEASGETCRISYSIIPERRGCGYGKALIKLLNNAAVKDFQECNRCFGEVLKENIASQKIFEELGYTVEERDKYFRFHKRIEYSKIDQEINKKIGGGGITIKQ